MSLKEVKQCVQGNMNIMRKKSDGRISFESPSRKNIKRVQSNISLSRSERNDCLMTGFERVIDGNRKFQEEITEWSPTNSKIKLLTVFFGGVVRSEALRILLFEPVRTQR